VFSLIFFMFRPGFFAHYVGIDNHYLSYLVGAALWGLIFGLQKLRTRGGGASVLARGEE
jgi:hypothetical protein